MNTEVELLPILDDNYVFMIRRGSDVCLVDPGESELCLEFLGTRKLNLKNILITHHHGDHIDGIQQLKKQFPNVKVFAPVKNQNQIHGVDIWVKEGDVIRAVGATFRVLELPGHTMGIMAYSDETNLRLFSGDVIFGLGCGRLFEGKPEMMFESLSRIAKLSAKTQIFCTHEYTMTNLKFVEQLIQQGQMPAHFDHDAFSNYKKSLLSLRAANSPSVPLNLAVELRVNPFLLCVQNQDLARFRELREARNHFRPK